MAVKQSEQPVYKLLPLKSGALEAQEPAQQVKVLCTGQSTESEAWNQKGRTEPAPETCHLTSMLSQMHTINEN